jgi:hypothetical protein
MTTRRGSAMRMLAAAVWLACWSACAPTADCPGAATYAALKAYTGVETCQECTHATAYGRFYVTASCTVDNGTCLRGGDGRHWSRDLGTPHAWLPRYWPDVSDDTALQSAIYWSRNDAGATVELDRTYEITQTLNLHQWITYRGGGLRRACSARATVTEAASAIATCLKVTSTDGFTGSRPVVVVPDAGYHPEIWQHYTHAATAQGVTQLCFSSALGRTVQPGEYVVNAYPMWVQVDETGTTGPTPGMVVEDMQIDGNGACNDGTHDWRFNDVGAVKAGTVRRVTVKDTPSETFTICGSQLIDVTGARLAGSLAHKSCSASMAAWTDIITGARVRGVNMVGNAVMGHSEGAVTLSANAGNIIIRASTFTDGGEGVLGVANGDDTDILAEGNVFASFPRRYSTIAGIPDPRFVLDRNAWIGVP